MLKAQLPFLPNFPPKNPSPRGLAVPHASRGRPPQPRSRSRPRSRLRPGERAGGSARGRGGHGGAAAAAGPPGAAGRCGAGGAAQSEWGRGRGEPGRAAGLSTGPVSAAAGFWDSDRSRGDGVGDGDHRAATAVLPSRVPRGSKRTRSRAGWRPVSIPGGQLCRKHNTEASQAFRNLSNNPVIACDNFLKTSSAAFRAVVCTQLGLHRFAVCFCEAASR